MHNNGKNPQHTKVQTLETLQEYVETNGYSPTYYELGDMLGISYVAAFNRVKQLARDKKVKFRYGKHRGIILVE